MMRTLIKQLLVVGSMENAILKKASGEGIDKI